MKKILFGIVLILMSMAFVFAEEFMSVLIVDEDIDAIICTILPIIGFVISLWGLLEKDK